MVEEGIGGRTKKEDVCESERERERGGGGRRKLA